jgi:hypothetical protein
VREQSERVSESGNESEHVSESSSESERESSPTLYFAAGANSSHFAERSARVNTLGSASLSLQSSSLPSSPLFTSDDEDEEEEEEEEDEEDEDDEDEVEGAGADASTTMLAVEDDDALTPPPAKPNTPASFRPTAGIALTAFTTRG